MSSVKQIYDPVRKKWVEALPEELVRQKIILYLTKTLDYPLHSIIVEKKLRELFSFQKRAVPDRRIDILCIDTKRLLPLLLIECKALPLQEGMLCQLLGYNSYVGAPLICLANEKERILRWSTGDSTGDNVTDFPTYEKLKHSFPS